MALPDTPLTHAGLSALAEASPEIFVLGCCTRDLVEMEIGYFGEDFGSRTADGFPAVMMSDGTTLV